MSDMPVPENLEPVLVNRAGDATRHKFDHTEECPAVGENGKPDGMGYAHIFRCTQTGATRRYGFDFGSDLPS